MTSSVLAGLRQAPGSWVPGGRSRQFLGVDGWSVVACGDGDVCRVNPERSLRRDLLVMSVHPPYHATALRPPAARRRGTDVPGFDAGCDVVDLLASIVSSSSDAMYSVSRAGRVTSWNGAAERLFGYTTAEILGEDVAVLVPEHRVGESAVIARRVDEQHAMFFEETERRRKDGSSVDVEVTVSPLLDSAGVVIGRSAIVRDITARRRLERERRAAVQQFQRAFESAPIGMALGSIDGHLLQANQALRRFVGLDEADVAGRHVGSFTHPDDLRDDVALLPSLISGERDTIVAEKHYVHADGSDRWALVHLSIVRDDDGAPLHLIAQFQDTTSEHEADAQLLDYTRALRVRMRADAQTGLATRAQLERRLARQSGAVALVLLRVASMDLIVRDQGQATADLVFSGLVAGVSAALRADDRLYRLGSGTVAIELPGGDAEAASATAARLRVSVQLDQPALEVDAAFGASVPGTEGRDTLLARLEAEFACRSAGRPSGPLSADASERFAPLLAAARDHLGMDVAWVSEFVDGRQVFRSLEGDAASFGLQAERSLSLDTSLCLRVLDGRVPAAIADTARDPGARAAAVTATAGIGAYLGTPVRLQDGHLYGMLCAAAHDARPRLDDRDVGVLRVLATAIAEQLDREHRTQAQRRADTEFAGIGALLAALHARDHYTGEHSKAVVELAAAVAWEMGLDRVAVAEVEQVALLHDIGKIGIPDTVLQKHGPLSESEWDLMRQHSALGANIVTSVASLAHLAPAVRAEHECWDGSGYPDGLASTAIPIASRIILAADAYHAMTSERPYRAAMPHDEALAELARCAGTQFDPDVSAALLRLKSA